MIVDAHNPFAHRLHSLTHLIIDESQQIACWHIPLVIPQCLQQRFNRTGQISRRCPVIPNIVIIIGCILRFFKHRQRKITFRTISIFRTCAPQWGHSTGRIVVAILSSPCPHRYCIIQYAACISQVLCHL